MKRDVSIIESQIKIAAINAGRPVRNASSPFQNGIWPAWIHDLKADTAGHQAHKSSDREAAMSPSRRGHGRVFTGCIGRARYLLSSFFSARVFTFFSHLTSSSLQTVLNYVGIK